MAENFQEQLLNQQSRLFQSRHSGETVWIGFVECRVSELDIVALEEQMDRAQLFSVYLEFVCCTFVGGASSRMRRLFEPGVDRSTVEALNLIFTESKGHPDFSLMLPRRTTLASTWVSFIGHQAVSPHSLGALGNALTGALDVSHVRIMVRKSHLSAESILPSLSQLIRITSETRKRLTLVVSGMPNLFMDAKPRDIEEFVTTCGDSSRISGLTLRNVGLTQSSACSILRSLFDPNRNPKRFLQFAHLSGRGFVGTEFLDQLVESLGVVGTASRAEFRNVVLLDKAPLVALDEEHENQFFGSLSRNTNPLPQLKLVFGKTRFAGRKKGRKRIAAIQNSIHELRARIGSANEMLSNSSRIPPGLWSRALAKLSSEDSGIDAARLIVSSPHVQNLLMIYH